jgi:hypothetical protein
VVPWHAATVGEVEAFLAVRRTRAGHARDNCDGCARDYYQVATCASFIGLQRIVAVLFDVKSEARMALLPIP